MITATAIVKLADKIIELLKIRRIGHREFFTNVIEPVYAGLLPVVNDYFKMFWSLRDGEFKLPSDFDIDDPKTRKAIERVLKKLNQRRERMVLERAKIIALAKALRASTSNDHVVQFADAIMWFFWASYQPTLEMDMVSRSSTYVRTLKSILDEPHIDLLGKRRQDKLELFELVTRSLSDMDEQWTEINKAYGNLRIRAFSL